MYYLSNSNFQYDIIIQQNRLPTVPLPKFSLTWVDHLVREYLCIICYCNTSVYVIGFLML